jgi:hypothetical protein
MFFDTLGLPFYVGKTNNFSQRKRHHLWEVKRGSNYPNHNKLRKILSEGLSPDEVIKEMFSGIAEKNIDTVEMGWIKILREYGYKLKNLTDGGEGGKGFTSEINKRSALKRTGLHRSRSSRKRMSLARIGMIFSKSHKLNLCRARRKRTVTLATRLKCSHTSKGKINIKKYLCISPEGKQYVTEHGLTKFCEERNLTSANLHKVLKGERSNHKGWTIRRFS